MVRVLLFLVNFMVCFEVFAQQQPEPGIPETLSSNTFYFCAQSHGNAANAIIEKQLLLMLNEKHDVRYNIAEYSHSIAFLINQYLASGEDSFLAMISEEAQFSVIKSIRSYNANLKPEKRISYYGIDFEGRQDGKLTRRAIGIILGRVEPVGRVHNLLSAVSNSTPGNTEENLADLRDYMRENEVVCREVLGSLFLDAWLIANAQYGFSPRRDGTMMQNFSFLYEELKKQDDQPRFFGFFGAAHVHPQNKKGIARQLSASAASPIKGEVSLIGVQYYNCDFFGLEDPRASSGTLELLCRSAAKQDSQQMLLDRRPTIRYVCKEKYPPVCHNDVFSFDALIIVANYPAASYWE